MFFVIEWKPYILCAFHVGMQADVSSSYPWQCSWKCMPSSSWAKRLIEFKMWTGGLFCFFFLSLSLSLSLHIASAVIIFINLLCETERENEGRGWRCRPPVLQWPPRCFNCAKPYFWWLCAEVVAGRNSTLHTVYRWLTLPVARMNARFLRGFLKIWI